MPSVDVREIARFFVSGLVATGGNLGAVWLVRPYGSFALALAAGICVGMTLSFLLSKIFAFQSRDWAATRGEAARFLLVYCVGLALYCLVAMASRWVFEAMGMTMKIAEFLAVLVGAGAMIVTSYVGHRFFTYRHVSGSSRG